jgi:hypothetical protein
MSDTPQQGKTILNAHIGKTNVIGSEDIDSILYNTFETISNILSKHCGPFGRLAMLPNALNPTAQPVFTKDGINIVKAVEFVSPMERYIKETVSYIGSRVDKAAGDGTTSSMIIATEVLKTLREYIADDSTRANYTRMSQDYQKFVEIVTKSLEQHALNDIHEMDPETIRNVAYHQAMTSSHGIESLSNIIADMFSTFPYECWNYITFKKETKETDTLYSMEWEDSDYTAKANIFSNDLYNDVYRTGFEIEDTTLLLVPHELMHESMDFVNVKSEIKSAIAEGRKLTIITANSVDPHVRQELEPLLASGGANPGHVSLFFISAHTPIFNDLNGMIAVAGAHHFDATMNYPRINNVKVTLLGQVFKVWGLFDRSKAIGNNHPDFEDPNSPVGSILQMLDQGIAQATQSNVNNNNHMVIDEYKRMYSTIRLIKRGQLVIGGSAYDNEAAFDVVMDTLKATRATLRYGACLGGYNTLAAVLYDILENMKVSESSEAISVISKAFLNGINTVRDYSLELAPLEYVLTAEGDRLQHYKKLEMTAKGNGIKVVGSSVTIQPVVLSENEEFQSHCMQNNGYIFDVLSGEISFMSDIKAASKAVIIQPKSVDLALIKRFGEVAIKFLFTERIVVPGGVVVNEITTGAE